MIGLSPQSGDMYIAQAAKDLFSSVGAEYVLSESKYFAPTEL